MYLRNVKVGLALTSVVSLLTLAANPALAKMHSATVTFKSQNGSGETGTATLTPKGMKTLVVLTIAGAPAAAQPAHIHMGTCATLNPKPTYPLSDLKNGKSTTVVPIALHTLMMGTYAINIHKSMAQVATYVSCGDIKTAMGGMMTHGAMGHGSMMPAGSMPSGSMPSGSMPSGSMPSGSMHSGSTPSGSMGGGSMGASPAGHMMSSSAPAPAPTASSQGPGSGGGSQVGPLPTPGTTQGPDSQASHSP